MKTKHIIKHFFSIFCLILLTIGFLACNNLINPNQKKANIKISAVLPVKKTVLPSALTETTTGLIWNLTGTKGSETSLTKTWVDSDSQTAYQIMQADSFDIDQGAWTFTLIATNKEQNELLTSTIDCNVTSNTSLSFVMQQATGNNAAKGSINFTLSFPANIVSNVEAYLYPWDEENNNFSENEQNPKSITPDNENNTGSVTCEFDDVSSGYYMLKLDLQQTINGDNKTINYYTCLVRVAPGLCSSGNAELTNLAELYTITYELNEGNFNDNEVIQKTYNRYTSIKLPTPIKEGYEFAGWYTDDNLTNKVENPLKITGNTTLYAGWVESEVNINSIINELKNISEDGTYVMPAWVNSAQLYEIFKDLKDPIDNNLDNIILDLSKTSITEIKANTFFNNTVIKEIVFPETLTTIEPGAFAFSEICFFNLDYNENFFVDNKVDFHVLCQKTKIIAAPGINNDYEIPTNITEIGDYAFSTVSGFFNSIKIHKYITQISPTAFCGASYLESFEIDNNNYYYDKISTEYGDVLISKDQKTLIACPYADWYDVRIPDTITHIGDYAFAYINIKSLNLNKVEKIGKYAFYNNSDNLKDLTIPRSMTYIDKNAFYRCESLTNVTFENTNNWYVKNTEDGVLQEIDVTNLETNAVNLTTKDYIWVYLPDTSTEGDASEGTLSIHETVSTYDALKTAINNTNSDGTPYVIGIRGEIAFGNELTISNNIQLVAASEGAKIYKTTAYGLFTVSGGNLILGDEKASYSLSIDGYNTSRNYPLVAIKGGACTLNNNCILEKNNGDAAIKLSNDNNSFTMTGGIIQNNTATYGAAIRVMDGCTNSTVNITGGEIINNRNNGNTNYGGTITIQAQISCNISNTTITGNTATNYARDIHIYNTSCTVTIDNCIFDPPPENIPSILKGTDATLTIDGTSITATTWNPSN